MPISVTCHSCSKTLRISDDVAGLRFRCNACGTILLAPAKNGEKSPGTRSEISERRTATPKTQQINRDVVGQPVRRKKREPETVRAYAEADTDWNETSDADDAEWRASSYHRPSSQRAKRKSPKPLLKILIRTGIVLLCVVAIPLVIHAVKSLRWSLSGSGIVCNSPPFGNEAGSVRAPEAWTVASVSRRLDDSGVRILFEDHKFSDHPETRTIFELSVIHLSPSESDLKLFKDDGQLDFAEMGYTGSGFPGAMPLTPPEGESYSTSYRTIDGIEFTRIAWSAADLMVLDGQPAPATTNYFTYWGRREDTLILMAGGYTTRSLSLSHPADAVAGTLQHGVAEAFIPASGVRPADYPQPQDIPRHVLRTLDDF